MWAGKTWEAVESKAITGIFAKPSRKLCMPLSACSVFRESLMPGFLPSPARADSRADSPLYYVDYRDVTKGDPAYPLAYESPTSATIGTGYRTKMESQHWTRLNAGR